MPVPIATIDLAITLLLQFMSRAQEVGALINKARSEGRDVSQAELDALVANDDAAKAALQQAIDAAKAKQP